MSIVKYTEKEYWDAKYPESEKIPLEIEGNGHFVNKGLYAAIKEAGVDGVRVLEIGAGDSQWLPFLKRNHPTSTCVGLDYSEAGCEQLTARAASEGVEVDVVCADLFNPPEDLIGSFDLIYSIGVVEHFDDLPEILKTLSQFLKPGGKMVTEIPNLAGLNGKLVKIMNREVYDLHNPHNLASLKSGHLEAGMAVESYGHIASNEFGILSACINEDSSALNRATYLWLSRLTKVIAIFESKIVQLPKSGLFSPVMYCTGVVPE